jgi:hypothetical protein
MIAPLFLTVLAAATPSTHETDATARCCAVIELRQYTLHPGKRDVLIDLFEREFVESQEADGIELVGTFRDLDKPDRFVWIRGFPDMPSRAKSLQAFYFGPVWQAHREAANTTMIDSDNVLLLRPAGNDTGFAKPATARAPIGTATRPHSRVLATIYYFGAPVDEGFHQFFDREISPALVDAGLAPIARLETEPAENTFPRLPVRAGEHVFVWFARFDDDDALRAAEARLDASPRWTSLKPKLEGMLKSPPERLVLEPTARSDLR